MGSNFKIKTLVKFPNKKWSQTFEIKNGVKFPNKKWGQIIKNRDQISVN